MSLRDDTVVSTRSLELGNYAPLDTEEMVEAKAVLLLVPQLCEVVIKSRLPEYDTAVADFLVSNDLYHRRCGADHSVEQADLILSRG